MVALDVRQSTPGEFWRIKELLPKIVQETKYADYSINVEKLEALYYLQFTDAQPVRVIYALEEGPSGLDQVLSGFGAFIITPHYFTDDLIASDILVYVRPERRGSTAAVRIIKEYIKWAKPLAKDVVLGISSGVHPERTKALYERLGFPTVGTMHSLKPQ